MAAPPRLLADTVLQVCRLAQKLKSRWQRRRLLLALLLVPSAGLLLAALRRLLVHRHTVLHFAANRRAIRQVQRLAILRDYKATQWLPSGHVQTMAGLFLRKSPPGQRFRRELLTVSDGGEVALDWCHDRVAQDVPVLIVLPGLTGGSNETYVQWLVRAAEQYGLQPVVFNARGCGGSALRTPRMFHAGRTEDMECVVAHVRRQVGPQAKIFAVGVSLGAGILVTYLARHGHDTGLHAAAALAGSYDFFETSRRLELGLNKVLYNHHLANSLKRFLARHAKVFQSDSSPLDLEAVAQGRTVRDFDASVVVPMFGFRDTAHYYSEASPGQSLPEVKIPLLIINARNDPIADVAGLDELAPVAQRNPNIVIVITEEGGHVGWPTGWLPTGKSWVDDAVCHWFREHLSVPADDADATPTTASTPTS